MSEHGIIATSVSDIASAADVASGTFYRYFRSKSELVSVICQSVTQAMHLEMDSKRGSGLDEAARVLFATQQFIEIAADEPDWGNLLLRAVGESYAIQDDLSRHMRDEVEAGVKQGLFRIDCDQFAIGCLISILMGGVSARLAGEGPEVSVRAGEFMLRILGMDRADIENHAQRFRKALPAPTLPAQRPRNRRQKPAVP